MTGAAAPGCEGPALYDRRVPPSPFVSFAADCEDVVLWRALSAQRPGRYVEIAPDGPDEASPVRALHDAGWHGLLVVGPAAAARAGGQRPDARVVEDLTQLPTDVGQVHVAVAPDAPTAARLVEALPAAPWVLHVTAGPDDAVEVPGYVPALTVGDVHLLVEESRAAALLPHLSAPPSSRDRFVRAAELRLREERDAALESLMRWRAQALAGWPGEGGASTAPQIKSLEELADHLAGEITAMHQTLSWRVTAPLRSAYRVSARVRHVGKR